MEATRRFNALRRFTDSSPGCYDRDRLNNMKGCNSHDQSGQAGHKRETTYQQCVGSSETKAVCLSVFSSSVEAVSSWRGRQRGAAVRLKGRSIRCSGCCTFSCMDQDPCEHLTPTQILPGPAGHGASMEPGDP